METVTGEVLNINNEYQSYQEYKAAVDSELQKSAESFVRIGYLLKVARDTDILQESGYDCVNEFAQKEYGLDKSQVSRFIRINDKYSEGGYSDRLQERYQGYGYAKLALMLLIPAEVAEELSENYSKAEIEAVKEEVDEERKISDLEVMMEGKNEDQKNMGTFGKVMHQLFHDDPQLYIKIHDIVWENEEAETGVIIKKLMEELAPAGEAIHNVRIQGEGRKMLSIKGEDTKPAVIDIRSGDREVCGWNTFIEDIRNMCGSSEGKDDWEMIYGENFPEKEEPKKQEVAPVQPKKQSKVTKAKVEKNEKKQEKAYEADKEPEKEIGQLPSADEGENAGVECEGNSGGIAGDPERGEEEAGQPGCDPVPDGNHEESGSEGDHGEEQLPGQMQLEKDFPEYCPEKTEPEQKKGMLTYYNSDGTWGLKYSDIKAVPGELYGAMFKLMQYERTGLSPEQIIEMDELYKEKCQEVAELEERIKKLEAAAVIEEDQDGEDA